MTDQGPESDPMDHEEQIQEEATQGTAAAGALGDFSTGEGMVTVAGFVLLAVWLVFEVITDDYGLSYPTVILAALAVILPRVDRGKVEAVQPLPTLMKIVGYGIALVGVFEIVSDLETGAYSQFMTVLAALIAYAGFVVAFMGARSIKT